MLGIIIVDRARVTSGTYSIAFGTMTVDDTQSQSALILSPSISLSGKAAGGRGLRHLYIQSSLLPYTYVRTQSHLAATGMPSDRISDKLLFNPNEEVSKVIDTTGIHELMYLLPTSWPLG